MDEHDNTINITDTLDYDKVINFVCVCKVGLPWKKDRVIMMLPCEHILHETCYNNLQPNVCGLCKSHVSGIIRITDSDIHHQRFADLLSVSYYNDMSNTSPGRFLDSVFDVAGVFTKLPFLKNRQSGKDICEQVLSLNNTTMKVYGMDKLKLEKNKVFICNHVTLLDMVVMYYLFGTGFLASSITGQSKVIDQLKRIIPLLTINRSDKNRTINIVDEMRQFVDDKGSICLFPEGMLKHPDALVRFRTGAFHINRPIYPIVIRHNDVLADGLSNVLLYKLGGKRDLLIEVNVLGPYYPPFDNDQIEQIRCVMAQVGNMVLSRVSNRDVVDIKGKKTDI
jgi:1-acyl-sn-glycerol-3-phosphate acyltransferase